MDDLIKATIGDYDVFLKQLLTEVVEAGFDLNDFVQMDHMAYRTPSREVYEAKKKALAPLCKFLSEIEINGRPIAVYRFRVPVRFDHWRIDALEVLAPKPGVETKEGLEHVEFVIYDDKEDFLRKYADKKFNLDAADRGLNPEIGFKLPSYGVKFHLLALPAVVRLEQKMELVSISKDL